MSTTRKNVILYADDDPDDLMLVKDAFKKYASAIEVVTVEDGDEALQYLQNLSHIDPIPCLIILDINMPKLNGKEVLKAIRVQERFRHIPVVLFSTSSHFFEKKYAQHYNAGFLTKPMGVDELEKITERFIDQCSDAVRIELKSAS
jgi:CheY-like chemotaxis protein